MDLKPHTSVSEFFHEAVSSALKNQGVEASEFTEFYLVNLLSDFATQPIDDQPLGLELAEAAFAPPDQRAQKLRGVGDRTLYISGFFSDSLQRRLVDRDYYIRLGGTAYRQLAEMNERAVRSDVYRELAGKFPCFVDVLAEVSEFGAISDKSVVQLYERWLRTGAEWIERRLRAMGVVATRGDLH